MRTRFCRFVLCPPCDAWDRALTRPSPCRSSSSCPSLPAFPFPYRRIKRAGIKPARTNAVDANARDIRQEQLELACTAHGISCTTTDDLGPISLKYLLNAISLFLLLPDCVTRHERISAGKKSEGGRREREEETSSFQRPQSLQKIFIPLLCHAFPSAPAGGASALPRPGRVFKNA